jgi:hypothetical protein
MKVTIELDEMEARQLIGHIDRLQDEIRAYEAKHENLELVDILDENREFLCDFKTKVIEAIDESKTGKKAKKIAESIDWENFPWGLIA